jgi:hypothetical protein
MNDRFNTTTFLFTLISFFLNFCHCGDETVSIETFPAYKDLRGCATCCFRQCSAECLFIIGDVISCGHGDIYCGQDALDSCFCRSDLQATVETYISKCVFTACSSNLNDMSSAVYAYTEYCKSTGQVILATPTGTYAIVTTTEAAATVTVTATVTVAATSTGHHYAPVARACGFIGPLVVGCIAIGVFASRCSNWLWFVL